MEPHLMSSVALVAHPRRLLAHLTKQQLSEQLLPKWSSIARANRERADGAVTNSSAAATGDVAKTEGGSARLPPRVLDAIRCEQFVDLVFKVVVLGSTDQPQSAPRISGSSRAETVDAQLLNACRDALRDLATVLDVCSAGWVTWAAFSAYVMDTDGRTDRWTVRRDLLAKWQSRIHGGSASPQDEVNLLHRTKTAASLRERHLQLLEPVDDAGVNNPSPPPQHRPAPTDRRKEGVLLWAEDLHDMEDVLEPLKHVDRFTCAVWESELLSALRRKRTVVASFLARRKRQRNLPRLDNDDGEPNDGEDLSCNMTPFPLFCPAPAGSDATENGTQSTKSLYDSVTRMVAVPGTPFIAAFTRSGAMFALQRATRQRDSSVPVVLFESSVTAVACCNRAEFTKSVPGLPAFGSFLAVSTAALRLVILCCRSFTTRSVYDLREPVGSLVYCHLRHILFGGLSSGHLALWAVSEKGVVRQLRRWRIHSLEIPITAVALASTSGNTTSSDADIAHDMMLVGYQDGLVVQINLVSLHPLRALRPEVASWRLASTAIDDAEFQVTQDLLADPMTKRLVLRFWQGVRQHTHASSVSPSRRRGSSSSPSRRRKRLMTDNEPDDGDDGYHMSSVCFVFYSAQLQQIVGVCADGTVLLLSRDFPRAPHQSFTDPTRRSDDKIVFAALDSDGTSVILADYSTNVVVVSLQAMMATWRRLLHLAVVEGLADRGRDNDAANGGLRAPRCYCGLSLPLGSSGVDMLLINTRDGCVVLLIDSASDPSSGALFSKDCDDLLICDALPCHPHLLAIGNPHQLVLYDVYRMERRSVFAVASPELLVHAAARDVGQSVAMAALCQSLDGTKVYVGGSNGSLSVARMDTGRALWRYLMPNQQQHAGARSSGAAVLHVACGGVGPLGQTELLCLLSNMHLVTCCDGPDVYEEHTAHPILRIVPLLTIPRAVGMTAETAMVQQLLRLPCAANAYWYVSANSFMSLTQWDPKHNEWNHEWVVESKASAVDVSRPASSCGVPAPLTLADGDSVFATNLLYPLPLLGVGTLHGEVLLVATRPHVLHGECVARWRQCSDVYAPVKLAQPAQSSTSTEVSRHPPITALCLVVPSTLLTFDATGRGTVWDIADVVLQLRCCSAFKLFDGAGCFSPSVANFTSRQSRVVHTVPRPPVVRYVFTQLLDVVVVRSFVVRPNVVSIIDAASRVTQWKLSATAMEAQPPAYFVLQHSGTQSLPGVPSSRVREADALEESGALFTLSSWRRVRKVARAVCALWRLQKLGAGREAKAGRLTNFSAVVSTMHASLRSTGNSSSLPPTVVAFEGGCGALVVCTPLHHPLDSEHPGYLTMDLSRADTTFLFDQKGNKYIPPSLGGCVARTLATGKRVVGSLAERLRRRTSAGTSGEMATEPCVVTAPSDAAPSTSPRPMEDSPHAPPATKSKKMTVKIARSTLPRSGASSGVGGREALGNLAHRAVDVDRIIREAQRKCFSADPESDPAHHTFNRRAVYLNLEKSQRALLAAVYAPRIVAPAVAVSSVADTRLRWEPFASLQSEVDAVVPPPILDLPADPPKALFASKRPLSGKLRSLMPPSAAPVAQRVQRPASAVAETKTVGFVQLPVKQQAKASPQPTRLLFV